MKGRWAPWLRSSGVWPSFNFRPLVQASVGITDEAGTVSNIRPQRNSTYMPSSLNNRYKALQSPLPPPSHTLHTRTTSIMPGTSIPLFSANAMFKEKLNPYDSKPMAIVFGLLLLKSTFLHYVCLRWKVLGQQHHITTPAMSEGSSGRLWKITS